VSIPDFPRGPVDVVAIAEWLMAYDSTSGAETKLTRAFGDALAARGWALTRIPAPDGRENLLATAGAGPYVTLSTHLDTVPPFLPARREGGLLYGRGSCDAKGIAAAMVCAAERLRAAEVSVALLFVVGEETTHDGAHAANDWAMAHGFRSRALINGEPTESTLALGTKGALRVVVRTLGEAAHSAYPHLGRSATAALVHLLAELDSLPLPTDPLLGKTTINIGRLAGGVADNVVAPSAEARLMARLVTDADQVWTLLKRWSAGRATLERGIEAPPVKLATVPGYPTSVVAFATDIPAMPAWGAPYLFGPGSIHVAHRDDEHVEIAQLEAAVEAYERLARTVATHD
ncbi:MAG TPA: M20/M25/M40 family metallo-hydrolase, partial [Gemmatimonadaceae bacterium]|nr:M20/M25/M40 family metallo-hydrolase [Gemmatimonadaceae bacterium]